MCTTVMASYSPLASASSTISAVIAWPIGTSSLSAGLPLASVIWCQRLEKAPQMVLRHFLATQLRTAPSIKPVEEEVERKMRFSV